MHFFAIFGLFLVNIWPKNDRKCTQFVSAQFVSAQWRGVDCRGALGWNNILRDIGHPISGPDKTSPVTMEIKRYLQSAGFQKYIDMKFHDGFKFQRDAKIST